MSLHLEVRWQDDEGRWTGFERAECVGGMFYPGHLPDGVTVQQARELSRPSSHVMLKYRPYALRIGFSR